MNESQNANIEDVKYIRRDVSGGYLCSAIEIANYRAVQASEIVENLMLGDYNSEGDYIVNIDIINELISLKKVFIEGYNNSIFCVSENRILNFGKVNFAVVYKEKQIDNENFIEAELQLLERIIKANGYYENTNRVTIAKFVTKSKNDFVEQSMNIFNIARNSDEMPAFIENELDDVSNVENILNRKIYLQTLSKYINKQRSKIEKNAFLEKMSVLKKSAKCKNILLNFDEEFMKLKPYFMNDKENYYSAVNELLDRIINKNFESIKKDIDLNKELFQIDSKRSSEHKLLIDKGRLEILKTGNESIKNEVLKQQATYDSTEKPEIVRVNIKESKNTLKTNTEKSNSQEQIGTRPSSAISKKINENFVKPETKKNVESNRTTQKEEIKTAPPKTTYYNTSSIKSSSSKTSSTTESKQSFMFNANAFRKSGEDSFSMQQDNKTSQSFNAKNSKLEEEITDILTY